MKKTILWLVGIAVGFTPSVAAARGPVERENVNVLPEDRVTGISQAEQHVENQRALEALRQAQAQTNSGVRDHGKGVGKGKGQGGQHRSEQGNAHAGPKASTQQQQSAQ